MNKDYLIAIDLDGTVIYDYDTYDYKSLRYLRKMAKTNKIVIATGRPYRSTKYVYDYLGLDTPIINYNGAYVHNPNDYHYPKTLITVDKKIINELLTDLNDIFLNMFCEHEDYIFLWKEDEIVRKNLYIKGGTLAIGDLREILTTDPNGAIFYIKTEHKERLESHVQKKYKKDISLRFWTIPRYSLEDELILGEIYNPDASKGKALKRIAHYYRIPDKKIIAFGDGHNDIDLLTAAAVPVAMGGAHENLLPAAEYITKSVQKHGVYYFLKKYFHNPNI